MRVIDFDGLHEVEESAELEEMLSKRFGNDVNEFLLSHDSDDYPVLSIMVRNGLAALHYIPGDGDAGFASIGKKSELTSSELITFATGSVDQEIQVSSRAVVPVSTALAVAKEFLSSDALPQSIEWLRL